MQDIVDRNQLGQEAVLLQRFIVSTVTTRTGSETLQEKIKTHPLTIQFFICISEFKGLVQQ